MRSSIVLSIALIPVVAMAQGIPTGYPIKEPVKLEKEEPVRKETVNQPIRVEAWPKDLTEENRRHYENPSAETAIEAVKSDVQQIVDHQYAFALKVLEKKKALDEMKKFGIYPDLSKPTEINKTLALYYRIVLPTEGLPEGFDIFTMKTKEEIGMEKIAESPVACEDCK